MQNHPNRKKTTIGIPPASPTPEQIREVRELAGHTQAEAARLIHGALRAWQRYEASVDVETHTRMPAAAWELYLRRCRDQGVEMPKRYLDYLDRAQGWRIDPRGPWRLYWGNMPVPGKALGTVTRPNGETGALILMTDGVFVQGNAGAIKNLPDIDFADLLGKDSHADEL